MSSSIRQSELFAGEDWRALYQAFTTINFNASDPPSIAKAMREYIQGNYPEDFNDWIESQEFVFILELLAWLGGTLAFKTDINARENFLETAEARESILRLARFLSYNPRRNQPARGLLKIVEIETDDDLTDASGQSLSNVAVEWDNPDDPDWFERFVLVMNSAFVSNNPFGQPFENDLVGQIKTQLYRINNRVGQISPNFTATASGERMTFEICNGNFSSDAGFFEREPNADSAFHLFYRNDGKGNASASTGFFVLFKQGSTSRQTVSITNPVENYLLDVSATGINDSDVWVQTISDTGAVLTDWTKVPALFSENITFNSISADQRYIYSVVTRDDDRVSIRFSDGRFGAAPVGNIRVTYRSSNGQRYQIRSNEIDRVRVAIPFTNRRGVSRTLYVTLSLQETVSNSTPRETDEQIRRRAPMVYATQNRMVSGEDYNTFPLQSNIAVKMKAVNRVYSGHSRFIDMNDPTGTYQDTNVFSDDGLFYREDENVYMEVPLTLGRTAAELIALYVQPALKRTEVANYMMEVSMNNIITVGGGCVWHRSTSARFSATGYFQNISSAAYFLAGATLLVSESGVQRWVTISEVTGDPTVAPATGARGPVTLAEPIAEGATILKIVPRFVRVIPADVLIEIEDRIKNNNSFTLWYDYTSPTAYWVVGTQNMSSTPDFDDDLAKVLVMDYVGDSLWRITAKGRRYVFESESNVRWFFDGQRAVDTNTGLQKQDLVRILGVNVDLNARETDDSLTGLGLRADYELAINKLLYYPDGYADPRRVAVTFMDGDEDGQPDRPDLFLKVVGNIAGAPRKDSYLFWNRDSAGEFAPYGGVVVCATKDDRVTGDGASLATGTVVFQIEDTTDLSARNSFWVKTSSGWSRDFRNYRYAVGRGYNVAASWIDDDETKAPDASHRIAFQWKHYAPTDHRIDPAQTNIIDIFVLTSEYDFLTRQWIAAGAKIDELPLPPTELDLRIAFSEFNDYKMFSDEIIWRPVQYKFLFGEGAQSSLRTQFKVVKLANSSYSDGEIKSRIVRAVNDYFDVSRWDFGETFYYTELAAYIHTQLAGVIGSVVLVPLNEESSFGEGFEVSCRSDELFVSTAQVNDIVIINSNTPNNLRIR